ncbi:MAG: hypothetical protein V3T53_10570, partial [Phycisphaerales bacterium]
MSGANRILSTSLRSRILRAIAVITGLCLAAGSGRVTAQTITEIIDATGDGAGNIFDRPFFIAVDAAGNAYVAGDFSDNAF